MPWAPKTHKAIRNAGSAKAHRSYDQRRGSARQRGYDWTWAKARAAYLREHPLCEQCLRVRLTVVAAMVDHIVPMSDGGDKLDDDNLQSLCWSCHEVKKAREKRAVRARRGKR